LNGSKKYLLLILLYASSCSIARNLVKEDPPAPEHQDLPEWTSEKETTHPEDKNEKEVKKETRPNSQG
jgi:hypothetical protein